MLAQMSIPTFVGWQRYFRQQQQEAGAQASTDAVSTSDPKRMSAILDRAFGG